MDACLVELAGLLVVAHDRLDLPALRIGLVHLGRFHVKVAFQDHSPEPCLLFLESCVVIVLRAAPDEVGLFLRRSSLVAEGIEELLPSFHGRFPVENALVSLQDSIVFVHGVSFRQLRVSFHRIEIMKPRILLEALRGGRRREALVRDDNSLLYAAFLDEIGICGHVEHVPGIALGTDRLLLLEIERIDDGNVPGALRPCLPREVGQGIDAALVALKRPVDDEMVVHRDGLRPFPHERDDPGDVLPEPFHEFGYRVSEKSDAGIGFREKGFLVSVLELPVPDSGIADAEDGNDVYPDGIGPIVLEAELIDDVPEEAVAVDDVGPVLQVRGIRGQPLHRNVRAVDDVADGGTVDGDVPSSDPSASDSLLYGISVLVLSVGLDNSVGWSFDRKYLFRNGHGQSLLI